MANPQNYGRTNDGIRFKPGGMNTVKAADQITQPGEYAYLQNVRGYLQDRLIGRTTQSNALLTLSAVPHTMRRLNDSTPDGPSSGFVRTVGAGNLMYVNSTQVASGLSGNPVAMVPFRPNASVQPWMYIGDSSTSVTITSSSFVCAGMVKIRSDGQTYKTGIKEPQEAPIVGTENTTNSGTDTLLATSVPWTNYGGINPDYYYGQTVQPGTGGITSPTIISTPTEGAKVTITVTGSATVNGSTATPATLVSNTSSYPGYYAYPGSTGTTSIIIGTFTDASGNVIEGNSSVLNPVDIGAGGTFTVPQNATQFQIGIDSSGNTAASNSGSFTVNYSIVTSAVTSVLGTYGDVILYYWSGTNGSSTTYQVGEYYFKNPNDAGTGTSKTASTASGTSSGNSWIIDATITSGVPVLPGVGSPSTSPQWYQVDTLGAVSSATSLAGCANANGQYQDYNCCLVGSIFVPSAGNYTFVINNKDNIIWGIGGGATFVSGTGEWISGVTVDSSRALTTNDISWFGQTTTVVNELNLMPSAPLRSPGGSYYNLGGQSTQSNVIINFPAIGTYQIEIDWDYWYHSERILLMMASPTPGAIPAIIPQASTSSTRTNVSYAYVYRSSVTGATSNPSPYSTEITTPLLANTISSMYSTDPQVDKVDYYRQDSSLTSYTYVGTGPNDNGQGNGINTIIVDQLSDTDAASNQILETNNYEPFPSIDVPKAGIVNVVSGVITWVSGDKFNVRWLPGTIILIGYPTQLSYSLTSRPLNATTINLADVPDGTNLTYNISEPYLAAQPLPSMWGPTDNTAYMFACGDTNRPGTLYFTKGNNPDSAPDTNQIEVTSPSEPLINGCIVNGIGMVFSAERAWVIDPTYTSALATVSGVQGSAFNLTESITNRGLYIRSCLCTEAGMNAFFRAKDGIYISPKGSGSQSITDAQLYNLFPHEGSTPSNITIAGYTIYPPNDALPEKQTMAFANGYLYYDYEDKNGNPRTLVYDVVAKGWSVDVYGKTVVCHALEEGENVNDTLVGCTDFTVRNLISEGTETATSVVATGAVNSGDARANKRVGDIFVKALAATSYPITVALYTDRYQTALSGFSPTSLTGTGTLQPYVVDFTSGYAKDVIDIEAVLSWSTKSSTYIDLWQPTFIGLPESTQDRPTDWGDLGSTGLNFVQGLIIEADTSNVAKAISIEDEKGILHVPNESPFTLNGQQKIPFTFTPPFISHIGRIISTDNVPWKIWGFQWVSLPYPESTIQWQTEMLSHGITGWFHLRMMNIPTISTANLTLTLIFDAWPTITLTVPSTAGAFVKQKVQIPANKTKLVSYRLSSTAPFYLFGKDVEVWLGKWERSEAYTVLKPFGGNAGNPGAEV
jgi:hypothetical protein